MPGDDRDRRGGAGRDQLSFDLPTRDLGVRRPGGPGPSPPSGPPRPGGDAVEVAAVVTALYAAISFPAGGVPDWDGLRALFRPGARLVQVKDGEVNDLDLTRFVTKYRRAIERGEVTAFHEREVAHRIEVFGPVAQVWSTYEARFDPTAPRPDARGINSIQLVRDQGRWAVLTILWADETDGRPIPTAYLRNRLAHDDR